MTAVRARVRAGLTLVAVVLGVAGFALAASPPASAAGGGLSVVFANHGATVTPANTPLVSIDNIIPGGSVSGAMKVTNSEAGAGALDLQFTDPVSRENGCVHAELARPEGCDPSANAPGQLEDDLDFALATSNDGRTYSADKHYRWTDLFQNHASVPVPIASSLGAGASLWVRLTVSLPWGSGNETQSDTFDFALKLTLSGLPDDNNGGGSNDGGTNNGDGGTNNGDGGTNNGSNDGAEVGVAGVSTHRGDSTVTISAGNGGGGHNGQSSGVQALASTGLDIALLIMIGVMLILCGVLLTLRWRAARNR